MISVRILIVDDDEDEHEFLRAAIKQIIPGAETTSMFDGKEVVDSLYEEKGLPPDLIFLDINMPKLNGLLATRSLKANEVLKKIPLIILTTGSNAEDHYNALKYGADAFFQKAANFGDLLKIVEIVKSTWLNKEHPLI
jgi:DNA-binding response OmpR family regulator